MGGLAKHARFAGVCGHRGTPEPAVTVGYFMLYGVLCGQCGLPGHHIEVYPNGVRTAHVDWRKRPCDSARSALKPPDRRVSESLTPQGDSESLDDSAPVRTRPPTDRPESVVMSAKQTAQDRLTAVLEALFASDSRWRIVTSPGCVTITRGWLDGSVDTLIILSPETAHARRDDATGCQVWAAGDTVDKIITAVRELPAPFAPEAPRQPLKLHRPYVNSSAHEQRIEFPEPGSISGDLRQ